MAITSAAMASTSAALFFCPCWLAAYSGRPPVRRTGAPGDRTCLDASCHVGTRFDDSNAIVFNPEFSYIPGGGPRRWIIRVDDPAARAFGLQLTTRAAGGLSNAPAGSLATVEPRTAVICDNEAFKGAAGCPSTRPVEFFHHTDPRPQGLFELEWTPPTEPVDAAVYISANASVSGQRNSRIHLRAFILRPAGSGAVVNAASLAEGIGSGAWFTIFGSGMPELPGLRVLAGGAPARIGFASGSQINALAPEMLAAPGPVRVEILRDGVPTITRLAYHRRWAPSLFATGPLTSHPGGRVRLFGTGFAATAMVRLGDRVVPATVTPAETSGVQVIEFVTPSLPPGGYSMVAISDGWPTNATPLRIE